MTGRSLRPTSPGTVTSMQMSPGPETSIEDRSDAERRAPRRTRRDRESGQARARRTMIWVTAACLVAAIAPGVEQLTAHGFAAFIDRPPGVGATPDLTTSGSSPPSIAIARLHGSSTSDASTTSPLGHSLVSRTRSEAPTTRGGSVSARSATGERVVQHTAGTSTPSIALEHVDPGGTDDEAIKKSTRATSTKRAEHSSTSTTSTTSPGTAGELALKPVNPSTAARGAQNRRPSPSDRVPPPPPGDLGADGRSRLPAPSPSVPPHGGVATPPPVDNSS